MTVLTEKVQKLSTVPAGSIEHVAECVPSESADEFEGEIEHEPQLDSIWYLRDEQPSWTEVHLNVSLSGVTSTSRTSTGGGIGSVVALCSI